MGFVARKSKTGIYLNEKWYSNNPFYNAGYGLPNCTCYAWGRYWEVTGDRPNDMPTGNAQDWWPRLPSHYTKSQTPVLGAIACWSGGGAGHVAVVEEITSNGDIITSNSGYYRPIASYPPDTQSYWWLETCYKNDGYRSSWESSRNYQFQGFILPKKYADGGAPSTETRHWILYDWKDKPYTNPEDEEVVNNLYCLADYLLPRGWTKNAIAGIAGNSFSECRLQPQTIQEGEPDPEYTGYGLLQWTPFYIIQDYLDTYASGWRNNVDINGIGQSRRIDAEANIADNVGNTWGYVSWTPQQYRVIQSYKEYSTSDREPEFLAITFYYGRERGAESLDNHSQRAEWARVFYSLLEGYTPGDGGTGRGTKRSGLKIWMYPVLRRR